MHRAARTVVFAAMAAGACLLAGDARADIEQDRQLYMLSRLDLENAQAMLRYYESKFDATTKAAITLRNHKNARRDAAACDKKKPGSIGICQRIDSDYQTGIRSIVSLRGEVRSALLTQRALVERLSREFNAAVANYVAAVSLLTGSAPAGPNDDVNKLVPAQPQTAQHPAPQDPKTDLPPKKEQEPEETPRASNARP